MKPLDFAKADRPHRQTKGKWLGMALLPLAMAASAVLAEPDAPAPPPPPPAPVEAPPQANPAVGGQPGARPMHRPDLSRMKAGVLNYKQESRFLLENKVQAGMVTTKSGLQYSVLKTGTGKKPKKTDVVDVYVTGKLLDGTVFAANEASNGPPVTIKISESIPAWREALRKMTVGSRWQLFVPAKLGYGNAGLPPTIGPDAALYYELELVAIKEPKQKQETEPNAPKP